MIKVTRINGEGMVLNAGLIESVEATPDTVITLINGHRQMVRESVDEVLERVVAYEGDVTFSGRCARRHSIVERQEPEEGW